MTACNAQYAIAIRISFLLDLVCLYTIYCLIYIIIFIHLYILYTNDVLYTFPLKNLKNFPSLKFISKPALTCYQWYFQYPYIHHAVQLKGQFRKKYDDDIRLIKDVMKTCKLLLGLPTREIGTHISTWKYLKYHRASF